jgi:hypothetical protein
LLRDRGLCEQDRGAKQECSQAVLHTHFNLAWQNKKAAV